MAIASALTSVLSPSRKPVIARSRAKVAEKSAEVILKLVPDVSGTTRATHKFFAKFLSLVTALGFLILLSVNILLAEDAFTLSQLKSEAKAVADEREAIGREMDSLSSPSALANSASALGMKASQTPVFLNLGEVATDGLVTNG
jgi:hypothetical protein